MKTMGKALAGLTTAKKPLVRRLKRDKAGEILELDGKR
jgi:hypothetical protein